ncbi:hypothetical protein [Streptomyces sp. NPDC102283]|uniref:hypothetical protein n=1 Tax=Streptomyces sp. NPDC102283 TaxID=3366155 RepID=UPI00382F3C0C
MRTALEKRQVGYVLAIARDHQITTRAGKLRADTPVKRLPRRAWQKPSADAGAKGNRFHDWALADITDGQPGHHLLVRRNRRTDELAIHRCYSATLVPLSALGQVAGRRWTVEETWQSGKGLAGLEEHQVRRWTSWHRWVTLTMLAHAFLAVVRAGDTSAIPARTSGYRSPATKSSTCSTRSSSGSCTTQPTGSSGPIGDAATRPDHRPATTSDNPLKQGDRDLQLEY